MKITQPWTGVGISGFSFGRKTGKLIRVRNWLRKGCTDPGKYFNDWAVGSEYVTSYSNKPYKYKLIPFSRIVNLGVKTEAIPKGKNPLDYICE